MTQTSHRSLEFVPPAVLELWVFKGENFETLSLSSGGTDFYEILIALYTQARAAYALHRSRVAHKRRAVN